MRRMTWAALGASATAAAALGGFLFASQALAHCDTLSGPVVEAAKRALETSEITPVLKWVRPEDEPEIKALFKKVLAVRSAGGASRELADRAFFENLVRIHRAGEGAPYTGLTEAAADPGIALSDDAIHTGNLDPLREKLAASMKSSLERRFARVMAAKPHAEESVAKGREYVAAYVDFIHFVERLESEVAPRAATPPAHVH